MDIYGILKAKATGNTSGLSHYDALIASRFIGGGEVVTTEYAPIASFITAKTQRAKAVSVLLEPIQSGSGTPSPDNVRPISGRTECVSNVSGKNFFDDSPSINSTFTASIADALAHFKSTGEYATGYTSSGTSISNNAQYVTTFTRIKSGVEYVTKNTTSGSNLSNVCFLDEDGNVISRNAGWSNQPYVHTALENEKYIMCGVKVAEKGALIIALGDTVPPYEPYNGQTYTTTLGRTVYGGTLDVVSGELNVTHAMVDLGTLNWSLYSSADRHVFRADYPTPPPNVAPSTEPPYAICSDYYPMPYAPISASDNGAFSLGGSRVVVIDHRFSDVTSFTQAVSGVQLCYELATPQTYQLTPTAVALLKGNNNLWSDGDVSVTYRA